MLNFQIARSASTAMTSVDRKKLLPIQKVWTQMTLSTFNLEFRQDLWLSRMNALWSFQLKSLHHSANQDWKWGKNPNTNIITTIPPPSRIEIYAGLNLVTCLKMVKLTKINNRGICFFEYQSYTLSLSNFEKSNNKQILNLYWKLSPLFLCKWASCFSYDVIISVCCWVSQQQ